MRRLSLALALVLPTLATANAPNYRDGVSGTELKQLIEQALTDRGFSASAQISSHRGYPACDTAPALAPRKSGDWSNIIVTCKDGTHWTRQVRSTLKPIGPKVKRPDRSAVLAGPMVVTLKHPIKKNSVITQNDIIMAPVALGTADGSFTDPSQIIGRRAVKNLNRGRALQARHLEKSWMILRDMPVSIQFRTGGVNIAAPGVSTQNGELGDMIEVRNVSSGKVLLGQIVGPQKIVVRAKTN